MRRTPVVMLAILITFRRLSPAQAQTSGYQTTVGIHYWGKSAYFGVLAGWGGLDVTAIVPLQHESATGPRTGVEFMQRMPGGLSLTGQVACGLSWTTSLLGFAGTPNSAVTDWRIAAGYEFAGGWGLEAGWRSLSWRIPTNSGCPGPTGCEMVFGGVSAALTLRR